MLNWKDIPDMYKVGLTIVAATVFVLTYHNQFITEAEATEQQSRAKAEIIALRVDNKESEKRTLVRAKAKAVSDNRQADAEILEQDIRTLRDQIKSLCDQIDEC